MPALAVRLRSSADTSRLSEKLRSPAVVPAVRLMLPLVLRSQLELPPLMPPLPPT